MSKRLNVKIAVLTGVDNFDIDGATHGREYDVYKLAPKRIKRYMGHFDLIYDDIEVHDRLELFYLWAKAVDDRIDANLNSGYYFLDLFSNLSHDLDSSYGVGEILTVALRKFTEPYKEIMSQKIERMNWAHNRELDSRNIDELLNNTLEVGAKTSSATIELIRPFVYEGDFLGFEDFFVKTGKVGNLIDLAVDYVKDSKNGELKFSPSTVDHMRVYWEATKEFVSFGVRYPFVLNGLPAFLKALKD